MLFKRCKKVPVVMQLENVECGAACLTMILAYHHKWVPLDQVREECGISRDGSNLTYMTVAAKKYGLDVHNYSCGLNHLMNKAKLPTHIEISANDFGLAKDSVILLEQVRTIDKKRLREKIGKLDDELMDRVNEALAISFGIAEL